MSHPSHCDPCITNIIALSSSATNSPTVSQIVRCSEGLSPFIIYVLNVLAASFQVTFTKGPTLPKVSPSLEVLSIIFPFLVFIFFSFNFVIFPFLVHFRNNTHIIYVFIKLCMRWSFVYVYKILWPIKDKSIIRYLIHF